MYGDGKGFVPDEVVSGSKVFIMLQNPGAEEEFGVDGVYRPAIGKTGKRLDSDFIPLAGLHRGVDVSVGNVIKCRYINPKTGLHDNELPTKSHPSKASGKEIEAGAVSHCLQRHTRIPPSCQLIVANGDLAWRSLGQPGSVEDWRGFLGPNAYEGRRVLGTYHPSYLNHQPRMTIPVMSDWKKVRRILDGVYPAPVPPRDVVPAPGAKVPEGTKFIVLDTEYNPETLAVYMIGLAYWGDGPQPLSGEQVVVSTCDRALTKTRLYQLITHHPFVFHNALADLRALHALFGFTPEMFLDIHDTIQEHALLQSEWPHDLGFVESMFSPHERMKHLGKNPHVRWSPAWWQQELDYNWGDCLTTGYAHKAMWAGLQRDPGSYRVYTEQNIPLINIRFKAKNRGVWLDRQFLHTLSGTLAERANTALGVAQGYLGFPLNLGSDKQVMAWLQKVDGMKLKKGKKTGNTTVDKDAIAELRRKFVDYDPDAERDGITPELLHANIAAGGHPLLEARAMYQLAEQFYVSYVNKFLKPDVKEKGFRQYDPNAFVEWCSPDQSTHSQASGRWSVTDPPLTTIPAKLRKMLRPPPGYVMVKYDADQQELRLNAHFAKDEPTLEAFRNGWCVHTLNTCDIFVLPIPPNKENPHGTAECLPWRTEVHWEGKDDKRRVFSKRFVFRLIYRGEAESAGDIPGAKALGLTKARLVDASQNYLNRHPALRIYWDRIDFTIRTTRIARSFGGRKRYLNGSLEARPGKVPAICREGTNHPIQSGGVDWSNGTILTIDRECRDLDAQFVYGAFDSHNWFTPEAHEQVFRDRVWEITQRPWVIDKRELVLPVSIDPTIYPV